jgi:hypothetical protein
LLFEGFKKVSRATKQKKRLGRGSEIQSPMYFDIEEGCYESGKIGYNLLK